MRASSTHSAHVRRLRHPRGEPETLLFRHRATFTILDLEFSLTDYEVHRCVQEATLLARSRCARQAPKFLANAGISIQEFDSLGHACLKTTLDRLAASCWLAGVLHTEP